MQSAGANRDDVDIRLGERGSSRLHLAGLGGHVPVLAADAAAVGAGGLPGESAGPAGGELVGPVAGEAQQDRAKGAAVVAGDRFEALGLDPGLGGLCLEPGRELSDGPGAFLGAAPGGHEQVDGHRRPADAVLYVTSGTVAAIGVAKLCATRSPITCSMRLYAVGASSNNSWRSLQTTSEPTGVRRSSSTVCFAFPRRSASARDILRPAPWATEKPASAPACAATR